MGGKAMQRFVAGGLIEIPPGPPKPPEGSELGVQDRPSSVAPRVVQGKRTIKFLPLSKRQILTGRGKV